MRMGFLAFAAFLAAQTPALAQSQPARQWPSQSQRWTPHIPDCTCRAQGRDFAMGEMVCLRTAQGARLAVCGMALNNSNWAFSDTPCAVSQLQTPW